MSMPNGEDGLDPAGWRGQFVNQADMTKLPARTQDAITAFFGDMVQGDTGWNSASGTFFETILHGFENLGEFITLIVQAITGAPGGLANLQSFLSDRWGDLANALDSALDALTRVAGLFGLDGFLKNTIIPMLEPWKIPVLGTSSLTNDQPNLLLAGNFTEGSVVDNPIWTWEAGVSHTSDSSGSVKVVADGTMKALQSHLIAVAPEQKCDLSVFTQWSGFTAAPGVTGPAVQISILEYAKVGDRYERIGEKSVFGFVPPAANGTWLPMPGTYTVRDGVESIRVRLLITKAALHGVFNFDDAVSKKTNKPQMGWIDGLSEELTGIQGQAQALITGLFNTLTGKDSIFAQLADLLQVFTAIPSDKVGGVGGPADIGKTVLEFFNHLVGGILGTGVGGGDKDPADVYNVVNGLANNAGLGAEAWDLLGVRNNKPLFTGFFPSGTSNYNITDVAFNSTPPTIPVTQSASGISIERYEEAKSLGVVSWLGYGLTDLTAFYVNIWKISSTDGSWSLLHHSPNILGDLDPSGSSAQPAFQFYILDEAIEGLAAGDDIARELVPVGTGTHNVVGRVTWLPNHPYAQAVSFAAKRDNTTGPNTPPATIAKASVVRSANVPWIETAINTGIDVSQHADVVRYLSTGQTIPVPKWANYVDVVANGAGGGGHAGATFGIYGEGGDHGKFNGVTWWRGEHFEDDAVITVALGEGGNGGTAILGVGQDGGATTVSIPGYSLVAEGGEGGQQLQGPGGRTRGIGAGEFVFKDWKVQAGGDQNTFGGVGTAPGGGAGGGDWLMLGSGGKGARGGAWIRFRRNALVDEPSGDITPPTAPTLSLGEVSYSRATVTASGATDNVGVVGYTFYVDGVRAAQWQVGTTYTYTGLSSGHEYTLTATARDLAGNESEHSAPLVITTLAYGDPLDEEMSLSERNAIDAIVAQCMSEMPLTPGLSIDITGPTGFYRKAYGFADNAKTSPYTLDLHTRVGSATKAFTAHCILILADRGLLDLDDLLYPHIQRPDLALWLDLNPNVHEVTIRQLLTMRSGVWEYQKDPLTGAFSVMMPEFDFRYNNVIMNSARQPASFAPGEDYEYCNTNFYHLGRVIETVSGKPYAQFVKDEIFTPLGMAETSYPANAYIPAPFARGYMPMGNIFGQLGQQDVTTFNPNFIGAAGGLVSTVGDLQKWGQELRDCNLLLPATRADLKDLSKFSSDVQGNNADVPARYGYGKGLYSYGSWFGHAGNINGFDAVIHYEKNSGAVLAGTANFNDFAMFIKVFPRIATYLYPGSMVAPEYNPEFAAKRGH